MEGLEIESKKIEITEVSYPSLLRAHGQVLLSLPTVSQVSLERWGRSVEERISSCKNDALQIRGTPYSCPKRLLPFSTVSRLFIEADRGGELVGFIFGVRGRIFSDLVPGSQWDD